MNTMNILNKLIQISTGSQEDLLHSRVQFPFWYRTVMNQAHHHLAIGRLLKHFGWTWVGIIAFEQGNSMRIMESLQTEIQRNGGCVEFLFMVPSWSNFLQKMIRVLSLIRKNKAKVIVFYGGTKDHFHLGRILEQDMASDTPRRIWILTEELELESYNPYSTFPLQGSLAFVNHKREIPGFEDFLSLVSVERYPAGIFLRQNWDVWFDCELNEPQSYIGNCTGKEMLKDVKHPLDPRAPFLGYNIYNAVYAVAHALHDALSSTDGRSVRSGERQYQEFKPVKLNHYLKKVNFTNTASEEVFFEENGESMIGYDLLNWKTSENMISRAVTVGRFNPLASPGKELTVNESLITWNRVFNMTRPQSRCSEPCLPGFRRSIKEGKPVCCYTCIPCPEGGFSNETDADSCLTCSEYEWSNTRRDGCIPREVIYLAFEEHLGTALTFIIVSLSVHTAIVLRIFIKFRDTPIVKANNRNLSYVLLLSLMLCFLSSLIFIGPPQKVTCVLRQSVFAVAFTLSVSSILGKTVTVVMAFQATKPGSGMRLWMRVGVSNYLVTFCSGIQVIICIVWLGLAPPFPSYDTQSVIGQMILECNEGSNIAFYCVLGYLAFLTCFCFIIAFLARNLPDSFNEAKFITFSMLVFCSVWVAFIPTYLSSKGKYMVAVEIFAILASAAGLLGCKFLPKCYVILLRPDMNTKNYVSQR
ncbi:vomeronasal type-2 receptor 26-like [Ambystoma mexicanum]|uniref:vomeronasal type-2 receptor 26-like n=1 Tax=Ambystoma mexicanum TaxID=8296 RepID=UPI0037E8CBD0